MRAAPSSEPQPIAASEGLARIARAAALLEAHEPTIRRTARRFSICADDAEDAFQRACEILLTKAPELEPQSLVAWMHVVTRREGLALGRARRRALGATARGPSGPVALDPDSLAGEGAGPRRPLRAARAGRRGRRAAAHAEAAGAPRRRPAGRRLLLRGDPGDHRLDLHQGQPLPGRGQGETARARRAGGVGDRRRGVALARPTPLSRSRAGGRVAFPAPERWQSLAECSCLESSRPARVRGFESLPLRRRRSSGTEGRPRWVG